MYPRDPDITVLDRIGSLQKDLWSQLTSPDFPFADHAFFAALEETCTLGAENGWIPHYLLLQQEGELSGATYLFTKTDSYGEYIFDWSWAKAYQQFGVPYYPKLISAVPFTPATGPKLLINKEKQGADKDLVAEHLIKAALEHMRERACSSLHFLFIEPEEIPYFEKHGFLIRDSFQYHWDNRNYGSFDHFLSALKPKRRKQIVRERLQLKSDGISVNILTGEDLQAKHADLFCEFYLSTIRKMQAIPYLNAEFFRRVFATMRQNIVLMLAKAGEKEVAGALYFTKGKHLYGRYWGASAEIRNLHFELCYYQPIIWAINQGIERFEAGAQGEHKIARGFLPRKTFSAHWIRHQGFLPAITQFIEQERQEIAAFLDDLDKHSPYLEYTNSSSVIKQKPR